MKKISGLTFPLILALLATVLASAGCGGENGGDDTGSPLAKAAFVKRADAICKKSEDNFQAGLGAYLQKHRIQTEGSLSKGLEAKLAQTLILPSLQKQIAALSELEAPEADRDTIESMIQGLEEAVEKGREDPVVVTNAGAGPLAEVAKLAAGYGFEYCG